MLRRQNHFLSALRAASHAPASPLHRSHLSTAAAAAAAAVASPAQFVVEDYLVASCGLAPAQARRASKYLRHLKSPANPDAVRAFLADAGLAESDIAAGVAVVSRLLCSRVDKTLTPRVAQLRDIGLSTPQISRLTGSLPSTRGSFVGPPESPTSSSTSPCWAPTTRWKPPSKPTRTS